MSDNSPISSKQQQLSTSLSKEEEAEFLSIANQLAAMSSIITTTSSSYSSSSPSHHFSDTADQQNQDNNHHQQLSATIAPPAHVLPLRRYLESSILPLLTKALESCALAKPNDPLEFLAAYLLSNNPVRQNPLPVPPCGALSGWLSAAAGSRAPALADEGSI